jgi:hypothetical protein
MNRRALMTATVVTVIALGAAMTVGVKRTAAQPLPLNECLSVGVGGTPTRLCLHYFSDQSKCVISVTPGIQYSSSQLSCKIS